MNAYTPIPTPPARRWLAFRVKYVPFLGFVTVLALAAFLWSGRLGVPSVVGEVESLRMDVSSPSAGTLAELNVARFERVQKDQVIGRIIPVDPAQLKASAAAIEVDLKVMKARMDLDRVRNVQSIASLRTDLELERLSLAAAKIQLVQAESELERTKKLWEEKIIGAGIGVERNVFGLEVAQRDRDRLVAEVDAYKKTISELETAVGKLQSSGATEISSVDPLIEEAIAAKRNELMLLDGPIELRAPMDGVISSISLYEGARVTAGATILTVSLAKPQHIIGFVRQPLQMVPKEGDRVEVRTRGVRHQAGYAQVLRVGSDMQLVNSPMRLRGYDNSLERGLPFLVNVPQGIDLYPGELVDLIIPH